jgi:hypothetical protein
MKQLSRRTLLRGAGAVIALPFLDAMLPAFARGATADTPKRMMYVYAPTGMIPQAWNPTTTGTDFEFGRIMKPLEKFRGDVLVMSGLSANPLAAPMNDGGGDHARAVSSYLTGVRPKKTSGADFSAGVSADQLAARKLGANTKFSSLELTCEDTRSVGECDSYTCAYQTVAWKSPTEPLPPEVNPRLLFERMFGDMDVSSNVDQRKKQAIYRNSILDLTMQDTRSLKRDLGPTDQRKLDEYLTSVRELEVRMSSAANNNAQVVPAGFSKPTGIPTDYAEHARLMFDLASIAFQSDMTRVATFMLAREGGVRPYPEIGVPEAHHSISHHGGDKELIEKLIKIECYHMEQFAYFVEKMKAMQEGSGSLLDNTLLVYGAALADPNRHDHDHCPTLLVGNAGGQLKTGQHVAFKQGTPMSNLHLTVLDSVGVPTDKLGNSEGKLDFLSAVS